MYKTILKGVAKNSDVKDKEGKVTGRVAKRTYFAGGESITLVDGAIVDNKTVNKFPESFRKDYFEKIADKKGS